MREQILLVDKTLVQEVKNKTIGITCENKCNYTGSYMDGSEIKDCVCLQEFRRQILYISANIPEKYWDFTFRNLIKPFVDQNQNPLKLLKLYCEKLGGMTDAGYGLFIQGASGLAKSAFAAYVMKEALKQGIVCYFMSMSQLTKTLYEALRDEDQKYKLEWIRKHVKLLVIDEIEKDYDVANAQSFIGSQINDFFRTLYEKKRTIILTSNLSKDAIKKKNLHSANIVDRFNELIDIIFTGESYRRPDEALKKLLEL